MQIKDLQFSSFSFVALQLVMHLELLREKMEYDLVYI